MTKKQLKDLKEASKIYNEAKKSITDGLNLFNDYCFNKIMPAGGDYLTEFKLGMSDFNQQRATRKTLDIPKMVNLALFPLINDLDDLHKKLVTFCTSASELIRREETP